MSDAMEKTYKRQQAAKRDQYGEEVKVDESLCELAETMWGFCHDTCAFEGAEKTGDSWNDDSLSFECSDCPYTFTLFVKGHDIIDNTW
jgi:hypothetical protein